MVSRGEGRVNGATEPSLKEGHGLSCKEEEEEECDTLQEVSGVWGGPSSSPPWQGCCHQPAKVTMASVTNLARAQGPPLPLWHIPSWTVPIWPQITL